MKIYFLLITIIPCLIAYEQSVRVTGRMMCHGHPAQYVELQLVSKFIIGGQAFARDVYSDPDGYFDIAGYIDSSKIDARLYVWHRCYEKPYEQSDPCFQWIEIGIPPIEVANGPLAQQQFDLGEVELKNKRSGQVLTSCDRNS